MPDVEQETHGFEQDVQKLEVEIRDFIIDNFLFGEPDYELSNDDSFVDRGIVDSTGVLELVMFVENRFGLSIGDGEMVPANLDSVNNLIRFITRKR
jgi:acyl carrier protein